MLRLRFEEPLPPRYTRRGESFPMKLVIANERGINPFALPRKGIYVTPKLLDGSLLNEKSHMIKTEPKKLEIDGIKGCCEFSVTITAKDKGDVGADSTPLQLMFDAKVPIDYDAAAAQSGGGQDKHDRHGSKGKGGGKGEPKKGAPQADSAQALLELNVISPSLLCIKTGTKQPPEAGTLPTVGGCVKTAYQVLGQRVLCCEGQQLVDDILPGLAHTVWDAGILLSLYIEHHLAKKPKGLKGARVIELGAGPGLAGCVAAVAGAQVMITDLAPAIHLIGGVNVAANMPAVSASKCGGSLDFAELAWGETVIQGHPKLGGRWDYILASDCIFNEQLFQPLIDTLLDLTSPPQQGAGAAAGGKKGGGGGQAPAKVLLTYRERERCARHGCHWHEFFEELGKSFDVREVALEGLVATFGARAEKVTDKARQKLVMVEAVRKPQATS